MNYIVDTNKVPKNTKKYTFAYLAGEIQGNVSFELWRGIFNKVREIGADLICYLGGILSESNRSLVFNLAFSEKIDGFISHMTGNEDLQEAFYAKFKGYAFVALSVPIPGFPVAMADSYQGMREVVEHLVKVHSYTKIAFVRGPEKHVYAIQRYNAYIDVVKENNIHNENLITPPLSFLPPSGVEAIRILLDERRLQPGKDIEAIVFISDQLAIAAFEECTLRQIKIPKHLALTGNNATSEALCQVSPITNIKMPFYEQGSVAVDLLIKQLKHQEIPMVTTLQSRMLLGQSCGCQSPVIKNAAVHIDSIKRKEEPALFKDHDICSKTMYKEAIEEEIIAAVKEYTQNNGTFLPELIEHSQIILKALFEEIENNKQDEFLFWLDDFINTLIHKNMGIEFLQDIISIFRQKLIGYAEKTGSIHRITNLVCQSRILVAEAASRVKKNETLSRIKKEDALRDISVQLITNYDIHMLMDVLAENLPKLDIPSCYISLYEDTSTIKSLFDIPEKARLILAYENGKRREVGTEGIIYSSMDLLPEGFSKSSKPKVLVVHSLHFNDLQIGFIIFEMGPEEGSLYNILRHLLSSAIQGALLVDETLQKSSKLSEAYQHLQENQTKLLSAEKMASLGRLTAGIAHEMNTPLASILAAMQELKSLATEYQESIDHPDVKPEDHKEIAKEMEKYIDMSIKSTEKSTSFIRGIKGQISGMDTTVIQKFIASQVIADTLNLLEFKFKHSKCNLVTEIDETIVLLGNPRGLSQIVTNLINNALEAAEETAVTVTVKLTSLKKGYAQLIVEDNGPGIPEENTLRIFDPLFTTKPFGDSSGLGLGIVKDLVNHFNGTIDVKSSNGITQFTISIPLVESS